MVQVAPDLPITDNCHHYTRLEDVPWDIHKYWKNRFKIFPNYNDGIFLTDDAWFGVTPEPVARKIAEDMPLPVFPDDSFRGTDYGAAAPATTIVDMFAGAGGNTIAFALWGYFDRIISIERDADTLACAQENARISGVAEGVITWVLGDCFEVLKELLGGRMAGDRIGDTTALTDVDIDIPIDGAVESLDPHNTVLFASPPWGGVSYTSQAVFDLSTMEPYNLQALHDACYPLPHALYLPRTSDLQQLADVFPKRKAADVKGDGPADGENPPPEPKLDVVQYCMHGFSKALVAYYPADEEALRRLVQTQEKKLLE
ncbi:trimethylguanosine synthase [Sporothrix schenckii 1099-18]|uniref:Trimethylguanosine synthase n=1 Tax=Sporothrix schenckii 1099-18 TaxID=1397361 RepID=A0A0F2M1B2_SPOSC|nr:trimethylguanosine synthase [Sporothrix schenckii 1099-18]KJR82545.1 trimethylguanosine synthase [Sporothrix schenckii 1099-18]